MDDPSSPNAPVTPSGHQVIMSGTREAGDGHHPLVSVAPHAAGAPFPEPLTYSLPEELSGRVGFGATVVVPLSGRELIGVVVGFPQDAPPDLILRPVLAVLDSDPAFDERLYRLALWMAGRYHCPLGDALQRIVPESYAVSAVRIIRLTDSWPDDKPAPARWSAATRDAAARLRRLLLEAGGEMELDALKRHILSSALSNLLRHARSRSWIEERYRLQLPRARPRTVPAWGLASAASGVQAFRRSGGIHSDGQDEQDRNGLGQDRHPVHPGNPVHRVNAGAGPERLNARTPERLTQRQQRVLEYLQARPETAVPQAELCRELAVTPPVLRSLEKRGLLRASAVTINRAARAPLAPVPAPALTPEQSAAGSVLNDAVRRRAAESFLLFGVTGSGKTEVYLSAMEAALAAGRQAIFLVPEISLTAQVATIFRARFGERVAILHSRLAEGERFDEWSRIRRGAADVIVGARSALFAPAPDPGIIVLDEEHDHSYKQDSSPRYVTRAVAEQRAALSGCPVVLGSATPSVETFHRAGVGALRRLDLPRRIHDRPLPEVRVVDLREEFRLRGAAVFSQELREGIRARLSCGEQVILFVNRRGFSAFILCRDCGFVPRCPRCNVSLTLHAAPGARELTVPTGFSRLVCHHCGHERRAPQTCPRCAGTRIRHFGIGTQRVEDAARELFPEARLARLDRDTTAGKDSHARIIDGFREREADILIGTQMVAKGFDFPNVTLVGIITADTALNLPDFRAAERTFQLLTQVAGRAGRGPVPGEVILQTFAPDHYAVRAAVEHDYRRFYQEEIRSREELCYPPFSSLARFVVTDSHEEAARAKIYRVNEILSAPAAAAGIERLGPTAAPLARLKGKYRWHLLLKSADDSALQCLLADALPGLRRAITGWTLDVDPLSLM
jgi:primosomal protein N' (replication factor Y)